MALSITCLHLTNGSIVLVLVGAIDYRSAADLRAAITAAVSGGTAPRRIVVDLRGVRSIDETGAGTLVVGSRICRDLGIEFAILHPRPVPAGRRRRPPARHSVDASQERMRIKSG